MGPVWAIIATRTLDSDAGSCMHAVRHCGVLGNEVSALEPNFRWPEAVPCPGFGARIPIGSLIMEASHALPVPVFRSYPPGRRRANAGSGMRWQHRYHHTSAPPNGGIRTDSCAD